MNATIPADQGRVHVAVMLAAACMMAHQLAGKATRDGFFLAQFSATQLPKAVAAAALLSVVLALWSPRVLRRWGPARTIPIAFALSGLLHASEWFGRNPWPRFTAAFVYLHIVGFGAVLLSGFWLLLSELFDPHEAKRRFGKVAGAGTAGGVLGGIAAERAVEWFGPASLLLLLAGLHLGCAALIGRMRPLAPHAAAELPLETTLAGAFRRTPLLARLALLVFLGSCTAALLDYLFKSGAAQTLGRGPALFRYFAVYYTACQLLMLVLQVGLARPALRRFGVAATASTLPVVAGAGSAAALVFPGFPVVTGVRAAEAIVRGSFFRSAYELFYTPVSESDKRAAKTTIDVACDRLGDAAGAGAVQMILWLPAGGTAFIPAPAFLFSAAAAVVALHTGSLYRSVLEKGLLRHAEADPMMTAVMGDYLGSLVDSLPGIRRTAREAPPAPSPPPHPTVTDPLVHALADLRSGSSSRVLAVLVPERPWDFVLATQAIQLLGWDEVSAGARAYLERGAGRITGQLADALLDPASDFAIRRRIPRILAQTGAQRALDALLEGLRDERFEVRFQCGRALDYLCRHYPQLTVPSTLIYAAVRRELSVDRSIWKSWRILDRRDVADTYNFLDDELRERADQRLEHIFSLLAVVLPRQPLMAAFRGLHRNDRAFRGLALEYLENALPPELHRQLVLVIEEQ